MKLDINPKYKKTFGVLSILVAGVMAIAEAIEEQRRDKEIEDMKKEIEQLKGER